MRWTQAAITKWAESKFGFNGPKPIAIRGNKEMAELLSSLENSGTLENSARSAMECADVIIFMMQTAERLGYDVLQLVDKKMDINVDRNWEMAADGSYQHVAEDTPNDDLVVIVNKHRMIGGACLTCGETDTTFDCAGF